MKAMRKMKVAWREMVDRCINPLNKDYNSYGGRGITVCAQWRFSFSTFLQDMGERPYGMTIERVDNNGNYEPSNCIWISRKEQSRNRRTTKFFTHNGITLSMKEWAKELYIPYPTLVSRIAVGLTFEKAITK